MSVNVNNKMSNIYIQEPPTNGKVLIKTSAGDIDIELWSKEAPKAARNFVQLCMEGYYDGTPFHRVVPEFIVQGGDPTGTWTVESPWTAVQGWLDELNNKHTIFGKVTGDTVYNMLRLSEVECDQEERPLNPHKIRTTEVLHSPFDDIIPRERKKSKKDEDKKEGKKSQSKATKNFSLLSFGEEAEEEEEMVTQVSQTLKGKSKSSHDLLKDDPLLSSVPAVNKKKARGGAGEAAEGEDDEAAEGDANGDEEEYDSDERQEMRERISQKLKKMKEDEKKSTDPSEEDRGKRANRSDELRQEARQLKKDLLAIKKRREDIANPPKKEEEGEEEKKPGSEAVAEYLEGKKKYEDMRKQKLKKGSSREAQTMALLDRFKSKLSSAITETSEAPEEAPEELAEDDDKGWMAHVLQFDEQTRKVKDANMQDEDTFEISDPRNPVNKRRREESKKIMKEKKAKR